MFPQTASIIQDDGNIMFYSNSNDFGNKALFLLIGAKVDTYFQRALRHFSRQGDKALAFIKSQCINVSNEDKTHFHHIFTTLQIKENESATAFIRRFIFVKTESESAGNLYDTALQLYRLEREHGKISFTLDYVEKRFYSMDEQIARDKLLTRIAMGNVANSLLRGQQHLHRNHSHQNNKGKTGRPRQTKTNASANATSKPIICYNCGEKDHISPNCPHAKNFKRIPTKNGTTTAKSRVATTTNSTEDDNAIVCSARVINYAHNSTDIQLGHDDTLRATDFPNVRYENDVDLTAFLNCSTYSTVWIETYNHFNTPGDSDPKIEAFMHDRPMEEDLINVATILELNHNDTISKAC
jgi:hypothetical protein